MFLYNISMKNKRNKHVKFEQKPSGITIIHLDSKDLNHRNMMHFEVQKSTRANVFRDRTKYTRKTKHKNKDY